MRAELEQEIKKRCSSSLNEKGALDWKMKKLTAEQCKLMQAYYAEAVSPEILKAEQTRLSAEIMLCEEREKALSAQAEQAQRILELAIQRIGDCHAAYLKAKPET